MLGKNCPHEQIQNVYLLEFSNEKFMFDAESEFTLTLLKQWVGISGIWNICVLLNNKHWFASIISRKAEQI